MRVPDKVVAKLRALYGSKPIIGVRKYRNKKTNGYASIKEARRAGELKLLEKAGEIFRLEEQVRYVLLPAQRSTSGVLLERECAYVCDFRYEDKAGKVVVEDVKGMKTKEYIIKRKMMLHFHNIQVREI